MEAIHLYFSPLWPLLLLLLNMGLAIPAALHALMTKDQVQSAIGWVGIIILSPFIGSILYICFGVNRVSRRWDRLRQKGYKAASHFFKEQPVAPPAQYYGYDPRLGNRISPFPMTGGNHIQVLRGGAETYPAMLKAIGQAKRHINMQSYIFDSGKIGDQFLNALGAAVQRGVEVRVMIDGVGAAYSKKPMIRLLKSRGVKTALFMEYYFGLTLPYANLRNHRKIMVVDAEIAFTGGMNIRDAFAADPAQKGFCYDTHFRVTGKVAGHLLAVFAQDWHFATHERIPLTAWELEGHPDESGDMGVRIVPSEPQDEGNPNALTIAHALSQAQKRVIIHSPYFIPNPEILAMLKLAALRQVQVDIILPARSNLFFVDLAARAQLGALAECGCNIWHSTPPFDHSKIMLIDDHYAYIGSTNMDTRSLRLNFEVDMEVLSPPLVAQLRKGLEEEIRTSTQVTQDSLKKRALPMRVFDRVVWLFSPYL